MAAIRWIRWASEYTVGMAVVLAHLALAGRGLRLAETLRGGTQDETQWR